ncbi:hypothetical protein CSA56_01000 [candidate division KSB3 bacterium]|uniref:HTH gntR-type domain-containing protein n=1 Tax=candidate division KSB3 bacterium TaxID=2044937 RepID=A0A2G6KKR4_9BACT|nr:MAG: hypothetical protein CSA56_01000 [candidate division KSB3 bacterium]
MEHFSRIKSLSRADLVVDKITNSIINGNLSDGELLPPEPKLCEMFGVSRSILREAIRVLASKGLLIVRQGYGTVACVPKIDIPEEALGTYLSTNPFSLEQLMELRTPIEIEVARLAARRRSDEHIARLEESLQKMLSYTANVEMMSTADKEFHRVLIEASDNPLFGIIIRSIMRYLHLSRQLAIRHFGIAVVVDEHKAIIEAITEQQPDTAANAMRNHMKGMLTRIDNVNVLLT